MRLERLLPWMLMPNIAVAGGGRGGIVLGLIIFLLILVWDFIKLWKFWFQMIFGRLSRAQPQQGVSHPIAQPMVQATKDCPYCIEPILVKARKCKHCGSDLS
ncbi:hypothetical protein SDC9_127889 [bioreactor metagenome]|uniref:Zinc-ribbon domain-containing protein n=1 Tax=bioreactor metagenome TaxID=1076179 RepID=A0A645CVF6_9ZZZZ